MKSGMLLLAVIILFLAQLIYAAEPIDILDLEVDVDRSGAALVRVLLSFDSSEISSLKLPAYAPENIKVYDAFSGLEYDFSEGIISITPGKQAQSYSMSIEYMTNQITSKQGEEWTAFYRFLTYNEIENLTIKVALPGNSTLKSFPQGGIVYMEDDRIKIEWDFENFQKDRQENIEVKYVKGIDNPNSNAGEENLLPYIAVFIVLGAGLAVFYWKYYREKKNVGEKKAGSKITEKPTEKPTVKEPTEGQKEIMHTLGETETEIIGELLKSGGKLSQKKLFISTGIPKSTLSRTIKRLQARNFIELRAIGSTNLLILADWFLKK